MRVGVRLFVLFILSGLVITFLLSWSIEFYKYQNRLSNKEEILRSTEYFERIIREVYPAKISQNQLEEYRKALGKIEKFEKKKFLPIESFVLLQPFLSIFNDQNLRLFAPNEPVYSVLPFTVRVIDKKVIVTSTATEKIPSGAEIKTINNIAIEKLINELLPLTSGETYEIREQQLGTLIQLAPEILGKKQRFVWIFYNQKEYEVSYVKDNTEHREKVKTVTLFSYPVFASKYQSLPSEAPYSFERKEDTGILKIRTFSLSGTTYNKFREFLNDVFVYNKDMKNLIIDVRGSAARDFTIFKEVFEHFTSKKIMVHRKVSFIKTAYILKTLEKYGVEFDKSTNELITVEFPFEFLPREPYSSAQVWVLFDRYTTHAALDFAYIFKKLNPGKTIGEETLTKINHTTDVVYQYFDALKTSFSYPTAIFSDDDGENQLTPDIAIQISTKDRIEQLMGNDIILEKVLKKITTK